MSGGHTTLVRAECRSGCTGSRPRDDDAAGEAFDKVAQFLGLGYPGGPAIEAMARQGDPTAIAFPRAMRDTESDGRFDFSFSGLKTAVMYYVRKHPDADTADLAASFQEAVVDVLVHKARRAATVSGREASLSGEVLPPTAGCARRCSTAAPLTAFVPMSRARRCAPTTRR